MLNLQSIQRELVSMLEESQLQECFTCNKLKCTCPKFSPKPTSLYTNFSSHHTINPITSPITGIINGDRTLIEDKINKSHEEIAACSQIIESAKTGKEVANITWPPAVSSIWNATKIEFLKPNFRNAATVEAFFKDVGDMKLTPENIIGVLKHLQKHQNNGTATAMMKYFANATKTNRSTSDNYSSFF